MFIFKIYLVNTHNSEPLNGHLALVVGKLLPRNQ